MRGSLAVPPNSEKQHKVHDLLPRQRGRLRIAEYAQQIDTAEHQRRETLSRVRTCRPTHLDKKGGTANKHTRTRTCAIRQQTHWDISCHLISSALPTSLHLLVSSLHLPLRARNFFTKAPNTCHNEEHLTEIWTIGGNVLGPS